ncbi:MAG: pilus assembly protein [Planctomycetales bacterium]|nr:pilus assembly protein [Planctomycetales bacterium]
MRASRRSSQRRLGVAAAEFAVCMPLVVLIAIGSIEGANVVFLRQALTFAAYEAAQIATSIGGTQQDAKNRALEILDAYQVDDATVDISPTINAQTAPRTEVSVTVTAPANANSLGVDWFFRGQTLQKTVTMCHM